MTHQPQPDPSSDTSRRHGVPPSQGTPPFDSASLLMPLDARSELVHAAVLALVRGEPSLPSIRRHLLPLSDAEASIIFNRIDQVARVLQNGTSSGLPAALFDLGRLSRTYLDDQGIGLLKIAAECAERLGVPSIARQAWLARAEVSFERGEFADSTASCKRALESYSKEDPSQRSDLLRVYTLMGEGFLRLGKSDCALRCAEAINDALLADPAYIVSLSHKEYRDAPDEIRSVESARLFVGRALTAEGRVDEAIQWYGALVTPPSRSDSFRRISRARALHGLAEALQERADAIEFATESPARHSSDYEKALELLEQSESYLDNVPERERDELLRAHIQLTRGALLYERDAIQEAFSCFYAASQIVRCQSLFGNCNKVLEGELQNGIARCREDMGLE